MATRGRKPKPAHLKLVTGNPGKRAMPEEVMPPASGPLQKPKWIKGRKAQLWDEITGMCWWLGDADAYKVGMWCALQAEFERSPGKMTSSRISQLRTLGSELGLDPAARARLGSMSGNRKKKSEAEEENPADKFFS